MHLKNKNTHSDNLIPLFIQSLNIISAIFVKDNLKDIYKHCKETLLPPVDPFAICNIHNCLKRTIVSLDLNLRERCIWKTKHTFWQSKKRIHFFFRQNYKSLSVVVNSASASHFPQCFSFTIVRSTLFAENHFESHSIDLHLKLLVATDFVLGFNVDVKGDE